MATNFQVTNTIGNVWRWQLAHTFSGWVSSISMLGTRWHIPIKRSYCRPPRVVDSMFTHFIFPLHRSLTNLLHCHTRLSPFASSATKYSKIVSTQMEEVECPRIRDCIYLKPQKRRGTSPASASNMPLPNVPPFNNMKAGFDRMKPTVAVSIAVK